MNFSSAVSSVRARLDAMWSATPVLYPNENTQQPDPPSPWVFCEVVGNGSRIAAIGKPGSNLFQHDGLIWLHVFTPQNSGQQSAWDYADQLADIFRSASFNGVQTYSPSVGNSGSGNEDGNWFRVSVSIPFQISQIG